MKTKLFPLAILAILILLSGCSKKKDVADNKVVSHEIMDLYNRLEAYQGMTIQEASADVISKGFSYDSSDEGINYNTYVKTENEISYSIKLQYNLDDNDKIFNIIYSCQSSNSEATIFKAQTYRDFIKAFGESHTLTSGEKVLFDHFNVDLYKGKSWSEMLTYLDKSFPDFNVVWYGKEIEDYTEENLISVVEVNLVESYILKIRIHDVTYSHEQKK